jgi:ankyrin repeat protein
VAQLRRWGRQGVRVMSDEPLWDSVANGAPLDQLRCLVKDLGANVNQPVRGLTPLLAVVHLGSRAKFGNQTYRLDMVSCLVEELAADVNKRGTPDGRTALYKATSDGNLDMVRCLLKLRANVNRQRTEA